MPPKFKLKKGMYLVITKTLENETPEVVAYGFEYARVWKYWIDNPDRNWELAEVKTVEVGGLQGKREVHQVWRVTNPMPPSRWAKHNRVFFG